jgi:hypothetical protein
MSDWIIGDTTRMGLDVADAAGLPADPGTLTLSIKPPSGPIVVVANPTRAATGAYRHDLLLDQRGTWYYRWASGAPLPAVAEGSIKVNPSRFVP